MPLYLGKDKITNVIYTDTSTREGELKTPSIDKNGLITSSVKKQGYMFASDKFNTTLQLPKNSGGVVNPSAETTQTLASAGEYMVKDLILPNDPNLNENNIKFGTSIYGVEGMLKSSIPPIENSWPNNDRPLSTSTTLYFEGVEAIPKYMNIFCWGNSPDNEYDPNGPGATGTVMMDYISQSISQNAFALSLNYSQEEGTIKGNSIIGGIESPWTAFFYGFHVFEYDSESKILTIKLKELTREETQEIGYYPILFFSSEEYKYYLNYSF